jgi:hypothetical protein
MSNETKTELVAWSGETYKGAGDYYEQFNNDPEFLEYTEDLEQEERLRLALFSYNNCWRLVPEDLPALMAQEQEAFWGEFESGAKFAEHLAEELGDMPEGLPSWICIDWEASWERNLRHDFFTYDVIDIDGGFRKFFWNANV